MDRNDIDDKRAAIAARFQEGQFSEDVLRASLFATRLRGDELETAVRDQLEIKHHDKSLPKFRR